MSEESLEDPVRETHGHFDGLLRLISASALQITDRRVQKRLYGAYLTSTPPRIGRAADRTEESDAARERSAHPAGSNLVNANEVATTTDRMTTAHRSLGVGRG